MTIVPHGSTPLSANEFKKEGGRQRACFVAVRAFARPIEHVGAYVHFRTVGFDFLVSIFWAAAASRARAPWPPQPTTKGNDKVAITIKNLGNLGLHYYHV